MCLQGDEIDGDNRIGLGEILRLHWVAKTEFLIRSPSAYPIRARGLMSPNQRPDICEHSANCREDRRRFDMPGVGPYMLRTRRNATLRAVSGDDTVATSALRGA